MIIFVVGDFGVGKDTFADLMVKNLTGAAKIKSYTNRKPRYDGEDTHIFSDKTEVPADYVAYTQIGDNLYWTDKSQFKKHQYDVYVIDDYGLKMALEANVDKYVVVQVLRDKNLIDVDENRLNRERKYSFDYDSYIDFVVENNDSIDSLEEIAKNIIIQILNERY